VTFAYLTTSAPDGITSRNAEVHSTAWTKLAKLPLCVATAAPDSPTTGVPVDWDATSDGSDEASEP